VGVTLAELEDDPHPILARLRATEPVAWVPALAGWLVTRYDLAVRIMRDPRVFTVDDPRFSTARVIGRSMLSTDGAEHARHREPFAQPFRPAEVRDRFEAFVEARTGELVAAIEPDGHAELRSTVAGPLAVAVVAEALGLEDVTAATVLSWYGAIVEAVSDVTAGRPARAAGAAAFDALRDNVERTIAARHGPSILVDAVRTLRSGEVVSNAAVLMFGGIDTTAGMITNAVRHVLGHPEALELARGAGIGNVIEESLRLEPTAAVVDRYATRDVELGDAAIRRGDLVVVSIAGANRDPAVFADPDRFDPHRDNARLNLAFAQGPHFCLGAQLARSETRIVLRTLLELPGLRLDPDRRNAPRGLVFRRPERLDVRWTTPHVDHTLR
jgi:cytochrome P450